MGRGQGGLKNSTPLPPPCKTRLWIFMSRVARLFFLDVARGVKHCNWVRGCRCGGGSFSPNLALFFHRLPSITILQFVCCGGLKRLPTRFGFRAIITLRKHLVCHLSRGHYIIGSQQIIWSRPPWSFLAEPTLVCCALSLCGMLFLPQ